MLNFIYFSYFAFYLSSHFFHKCEYEFSSKVSSISSSILTFFFGFLSISRLCRSASLKLLKSTGSCIMKFKQIIITLLATENLKLPW